MPIYQPSTSSSADEDSSSEKLSGKQISPMVFRTNKFLGAPVEDLPGKQISANSVRSSPCLPIKGRKAKLEEIQPLAGKLREGSKQLSWLLKDNVWQIWTTSAIKRTSIDDDFKIIIIVRFLEVLLCFISLFSEFWNIIITNTNTVQRLSS